MSDRIRQNSGSRFLYEPFDLTKIRIESHQKVNDERWQALQQRLDVIETTLERVERRLWLAMFGVVAFVFSRGILNWMETLL